MSIANKLSSDLRDLRIQYYLIYVPLVAIFIVIQIFRKRFQDIEEEMNHVAGPQKYSIVGSISTLKEDEENFTT